MKKQIIIALAFSMSAFSFAQKKELKTAEKAIKISKYAEAKAALKQAEGLMSAMDDKTKAKYYYLNGQALYAGGTASIEDSDKSLESLNKAESAYPAEVKKLKEDIANNLVTKGNSFYEKNDYAISSKYFEKAYRLRQKDTLFLYYAAATAVSVKDYDRALTLYEELKQLDYTGISTQYIAINKETDKEETFDSQSMRDISVKAKTHINPSEKVTESKKPEIFKNIALIYISKEESDKAISSIKEARVLNPDDAGLVITEANIQYKLGNTEEFKSLLEKATTMEPDNPNLHYNIGIVNMESGNTEAAESCFEKVLELESSNANAALNLSYLSIEEGNLVIEEMSKLGMSNADNIKYDKLKVVKNNLFQKGADILSKFVSENPDANLKEIYTQLKNIYSALGETQKAKEIQAKLEAVTSEN